MVYEQVTKQQTGGAMSPNWRLKSPNRRSLKIKDQSQLTVPAVGLLCVLRQSTGADSLQMPRCGGWRGFHGPSRLLALNTFRNAPMWMGISNIPDRGSPAHCLLLAEFPTSMR